LFYPYWKGRQIVPPLSKEVFYELLKLGMDLNDVLFILENGFDCGEKRRKNIIEKCLIRKNKVLKVVVELKVSKKGNEYWKIRHVGMYGR